MAINTDTPISEVQYNGVEIPLSAGKQLYSHYITFSIYKLNPNIGGTCFATIINNDPSSFTFDSFKSYLQNNNLTGSSRQLSATGLLYDQDDFVTYKGIVVCVSNYVDNLRVTYVDHANVLHFNETMFPNMLLHDEVVAL